MVDGLGLPDFGFGNEQPEFGSVRPLENVSQEVAEANLAKDLAEAISRKYDERLGYMSLPTYNTVMTLVRAVRIFSESHPDVRVAVDWGSAELRFQAKT